MGFPLNLILRFDYYFSKIEEYLLILILSSIVFFSFLQVIFRGLLSSGIPWADIFLRHLVLWIAFIGASLATRREKHISINISSKFFSGKLEIFRKIIINAISGIVCYYLLLAAWTFTLDEKMAGSEIFYGIPTYYFLTILPFAFALMTFRFFLKTISEIAELLSKKQTDFVA